MLWIASFDENKPDKKFEIIEEIKDHPTAFLKFHKEYEPYDFCFELAGEELEFFTSQGIYDKTQKILINEKRLVCYSFLILEKL